MSAPEGKTDVPREPGHFRFRPNCDISCALRQRIDTGFGPYQSPRLSRKNASSRIMG
jgi:hypothetical protein